MQKSIAAKATAAHGVSCVEAQAQGEGVSNLLVRSQRQSAVSQRTLRAPGPVTVTARLVNPPMKKQIICPKMLE